MHKIKINEKSQEEMLFLGILNSVIVSLGYKDSPCCLMTHREPHIKSIAPLSYSSLIGSTNTRLGVLHLFLRILNVLSSKRPYLGVRM